MPYLMIENPGICPLEGFTILGLSTARSDDASIGQFGSGNKHGVLTLMRAGLQPTIFLGAKRLEFSTKLKSMGSKQYQQVYYKLNGTTYPLNMSLEYGELDWTDIDMALREFVSNALDQANGNAKRIRIEFVDKVEHKAGTTRVFIPDAERVRSFFNSITDRFLHFTCDVKQKVLPKKNVNSPAKVYRKGVFVRSFSDYTTSLYHYNFGSELRIDEARNLSDYSCYQSIGDVLTDNADILQKTLQDLHKLQGLRVIEARLASYHLERAKMDPKTVQKTFKRAFGPQAVLAHENYGPMLNQAMTKGYRPIIMPDGWFNFLKDSDVSTVLDVLDDVNDEGHRLNLPCEETQKIAKNVWQMFVEMDLTKGKEMPKVVNYENVMNGGTSVHGYYKNGVVHISYEHKSSVMTMIEEMAHYVTGANDCTRDFQTFAFQGWAKLMDMVW